MVEVEARSDAKQVIAVQLKPEDHDNQMRGEQHGKHREQPQTNSSRRYSPNQHLYPKPRRET